MLNRRLVNYQVAPGGTIFFFNSTMYIIIIIIIMFRHYLSKNDISIKSV